MSKQILKYCLAFKACQNDSCRKWIEQFAWIFPPIVRVLPLEEHFCCGVRRVENWGRGIAKMCTCFPFVLCIVVCVYAKTKAVALNPHFPALLKLMHMLLFYFDWSKVGTSSPKRLKLSLCRVGPLDGLIVHWRVWHLICTARWKLSFPYAWVNRCHEGREGEDDLELFLLWNTMNTSVSYTIVCVL